VAPELPPESGPAPLKLRAEDAEDLAVISACLQDALVSVRDLAYTPDDGSFLMVANRFRWENGGGTRERVLCAVRFGEVSSVAYRGFRRTDEDRLLALLAIRPELDAGSGTIRLDFAGGAEIRLGAARIRCHAMDLGEPWPTVWQPDHLIEEP
jgi:hypothetical protein